MKNHFDLSDQDFVEAFQHFSLKPSHFSHEAHLRLAWLYISDHGLEKAIGIIQEDLKKYVTHWGATDKYHTTLTIASVKAVYHFMLKSKSHTFVDFIEEFPLLKYHFKELLACHYTTDILYSEASKKTYVEPELLPFD